MNTETGLCLTHCLLQTGYLILAAEEAGRGGEEPK